MEVYEAIWKEVNEQEGIIITRSFLAQTRYLAKHYCGAPLGVEVYIRKRRIMLS